ncbi:MAG: ATP-dependent Clp protease ATP-binding subunit [bacterium]
MFNFNLKKTAIFQSIRYAQNPILKFAGFWRKLFSVAFLVFILLFFYDFIKNQTPETGAVFLGLIILSLTFLTIFWLIEIFYGSIIKPKLRFTIGQVFSQMDKEYNLAELLDLESARAIKQAIKFTEAKKLGEMNSTILLYFLLKNRGVQIAFIFSRANLDLKGSIQLLKKEIDGLVEKKGSDYSVDFQDVILEALRNANAENQDRIRVGDLLVGLAEYNSSFKKILIEAELRKEDITNLAWWFFSLENRLAERKIWWGYENLLQYGSIGKDWGAGYTITLDQYSLDWSLTEEKIGLGEIISHKVEVKETERILARSEINNVLLIGQPGVNRKDVIKSIAKRARIGKSLPEINYKRIVELDIPLVLSQSNSFEETERVLEKIFYEAAEAGNVILVIGEFHEFIGQSVRLGAADISGLLARYLHLPQFQVIAITSYVGLHKYIEQRPTILNLFGKVEVRETSERETILLLKSLACFLEEKYKIFITYPAIRDIIKYTARYIPNIPFPKKALDILDELAIYVTTSTKSRVILPEHVISLMSEKTETPIGEAQSREKEVLLTLESLIHKKIINQEEAVREISEALRRSRADVSTKKGPMGTFLFLGPTGVGKTETAKALAEIYFGSEDKIIRLDMSEFQVVEDIPRLIGSPGEEGLLTTKVKEDPFSLVLLDELEKAHPNISNLFLQVLDEGYLTDGMGRKISFKDVIIIATSNAGYKIILEALDKKTAWPRVKQKILDFLFEEGIFRPEFINRFDGVTIFKPLSPENLLAIAGLLLGKLRKNLDNKGIKFNITEELKKKIAKLGYNPTFGAREMKRVIQDKVENVLATAILEDKIKKGDEISIDHKNFAIIKKEI